MFRSLKVYMVSREKQFRAMQSLANVFGGPRLREPDPLPRNVSPLCSLSEIFSYSIRPLRRPGGPFGTLVLNDVEAELHELKTRLIVLGREKPSQVDAEQLTRKPQLDLKCFPLLTAHHLTECINTYVSVVDTVKARDCYYQFLISLVMGDFCELSTCPKELVLILRLLKLFPDIDRKFMEYAVDRYVGICNNYCPSSSQDSKNKLLETVEYARVGDLKFLYQNLLAKTLFG